jgi:ATP-dependent DNA helicase RecG
MEKFSRGAIRLLVATTVIEVGVDVPNATLMVIENAERMGYRSCTRLRGAGAPKPRPASCSSRRRWYNERLKIICRPRWLRDRAPRPAARPGELLGARQSGFRS